MKIYRTSQEQDTERAARQAAEWLHAMKSDPSLQEREEFASWVQASQLNLREMLVAGAVEQTLDTPGLLDEFDIDALIAQGVQDDTIVPLRPAGKEPRAASLRMRPAYTRPWARAALAASVLLAAATGLWFGVDQRRPRVAEVSYATAIGENTTVQLADGSTVQLHPRSRLRVRFSSGERNIELDSGEAAFAVAHDSTRPFRVHAGTSVVQAVGTHFVVNRLPSGTFVAVTEGKVKVTAERPSPLEQGVGAWLSSLVITAPAPKPRVDAVIEPLVNPVPLVAGQAARIENNARMLQRAALDPALVAPSAGARRLVFHDDTLADIVDAFNRYNSRQIHVPADAGRAQRYSGVFDANDPGSFLQFLECCTALKVVERGSLTVVESRTAAR